MILYIDTEITEAGARDFIKSLPSESTPLTVHFNSMGGEVDAALKIYDALVSRETLTTVADGLVYSSAIIPFLAGKKRVFTTNAKFLIHPATFNILENTSIEDLEDLKNELTAYTELIETVYKKEGVAPDVTKHLYGSKDLQITDYSTAQRGGLVTESQQLTAISNFAKILNFWRYKNKKPIQKYQYNAKTLKKTLNFYNMNEEKINMTSLIKELVSKISDLEKNQEKTIRKVLNEMAEIPENNEPEAITPEAAAALAPLIFATPANFQDLPQVANLVHFGTSSIGNVIPTDANGVPINLEDGEYKGSVGGAGSVANVLNGVMNVSLAVENNENNETEETEEGKNEEPKTETTPEEPENNETEEVKNEPAFSTAQNKKTEAAKSKAPTVNNVRIPSNNNAKKALYDAIYKIAGKGAVGVKK